MVGMPLPRPTDRQAAYAAYRRTPCWQAVRRLALLRADHACQVCASPEQLEVHHRTYARLGREQATDLLVLCRACHALFHTAGRLIDAPREDGR